MPRFDVYRNPNPKAAHALYLDVQSDLVVTSTRWCIPLLRATEGLAVMTRAQLRLRLAGDDWLLDTPNIVAVPMTVLRAGVGRLSADEQMLVEAAIDFMLRGY
jgi:hypothetical protein